MILAKYSAQEWNERFPPGTPVRFYDHVDYDTRVPDLSYPSFDSETTSYAYEVEPGYPVVDIMGSADFKELWKLEPGAQPVSLFMRALRQCPDKILEMTPDGVGLRRPRKK